MQFIELKPEEFRTFADKHPNKSFYQTPEIANLREQNGFKSLNTSDEPKYVFVLELKNRTPDEIFADFKRNTRNHIRKAEKKDVKIRELSRAELLIFKQITESTSARRNFEKHPNLRRHVYPLWRRSNLSVFRQ